MKNMLFFSEQPKVTAIPNTRFFHYLEECHILLPVKNAYFLTTFWLQSYNSITKYLKHLIFLINKKNKPACFLLHLHIINKQLMRKNKSLIHQYAAQFQFRLRVQACFTSDHLFKIIIVIKIMVIWQLKEQKQNTWSLLLCVLTT